MTEEIDNNLAQAVVDAALELEPLLRKQYPDMVRDELMGNKDAGKIHTLYRAIRAYQDAQKQG